MKLKLLSAVLIFTMLFSGIQAFAAENFEENNTEANYAITTLTDEELKKCELSGVYKKDWAQRLQWFESKIIDRYKSFNAKNILVVGEQKFLDAFKVAVEKHDWQANFIYATSANNIIKNDEKIDLVIDTLYDINNSNFDKIYQGFRVSCFKNVYTEILYDETLDFLEKNGVKYYFFEVPNTSQIKNLDAFEKLAAKRAFMPLAKNEGFVKLLFANKPKLIECMLENAPHSGRNNKLFYNGKYNVAADTSGEIYNVKDGKRNTVGNPIAAKNSINMYGPCTVYGYLVDDANTISSHLQKKLNELGFSYSVNNYGNSGRDLINNFEAIIHNKFSRGDIVIGLDFGGEKIKSAVNKYSFKYEETSHLFNRPHNYGYWLIDYGTHINHVGNEVIANYMYDIINPDLNKNEPTEPVQTVKYQFENEVDTFLDDNPDLKNYLDGLKEVKEKNNVNGKIGSIVMNCNPFTLGHRYLIEQAASQVDHLYIFVVEEDKSVFPFKDRIDLVKKGVADLGDKVTVLPSGKWIISLLTFPEYFSKDDKQEDIIDPSQDVKLFGKYICPALGINKRFVGEEPFDKVTKQYNESMRKELPNFNVEFEEIPRKSVDGEDIISATKVRKALKEKDFETLKKYVPQTTFDYLQENCESLIDAINAKYK